MKRQPAPKHRFKLIEFTNPRTGTGSWRVSGIKLDGKRVRENFTSAKEAQSRQIELEGEYLSRHTDPLLRSTRLTETQVAIAEAAFRLVTEDDQLLIAVRYWHEHGSKAVAAVTPRLQDAADQFNVALLADTSLRDITKMVTRLRVAAFVNSTANIRISDLTPEVIEKYLDGIKGTPRTRVNYKFGISKFCSWCMERGRRWLTSNPCASIKVKMGDAAPPVVLSIEDCKRIIRSAERFRDGAFLPYVAVALFDGLRPFEARRINWEQVNFEDNEIRIEGAQSKTGQSRTFKMDKTTAAWLRTCKGKPFFPACFKTGLVGLMRAAGYGSSDEGLHPWTKDAMRHTAISHFFRKTGSYGLAAERFGNSERVIKRHYQGRVTSDDTKKFYALLPAAKKK